MEEKFYDFSKIVKLQDKLFKFAIKPKDYGKSFYKYSKYSKEHLINRIIELEMKGKYDKRK